MSEGVESPMESSPMFVRAFGGNQEPLVLVFASRSTKAADSVDLRCMDVLQLGKVSFDDFPS